MIAAKYFSIFLFLSALYGDNTVFTTRQIIFYPSIFLKYNFKLLKPGDIIIKKKEPKMLEWFGHCGVLTQNYTVAEFPKIGVGFKNSPISNWYNEGRYVAVLRPYSLSPIFLKSIYNNIESAKSKPYGFSHKGSDSFFYCSQFIWKIFNIKTENSKIVNLDSDSGITVWPYDILFSDELFQVKFTNYSGK